MAKKPSRAAAPATAPAGVEARVVRSRGVTIDGAYHPFGSAVVLPANQVADLAASGIVCTRPAAPESAPDQPAEG